MKIFSKLIYNWVIGRFLSKILHVSFTVSTSIFFSQFLASGHEARKNQVRLRESDVYEKS